MKQNTLLNPDNHALLLIDHQYLQLLTIRSHEVATVSSNTEAIAGIGILTNDIKNLTPPSLPLF